jgi:putative isomerase
MMKDTPEYIELQRRLGRGWNTWNTRSIVSWVTLPSCISLQIGVKSYANAIHHREVRVGPKAQVGGHADDGSYSDVMLNFPYGKTSVRIRTATDGEDLVLLADPVCDAVRKSVLVVEIGVLWNRTATLSRQGDHLLAEAEETVRVFGIGQEIDDPNVIALTPYLALELSEPVGVSTGRKRSMDEIRRLIEAREAEHTARKEAYGELAEVYDAIQTCTAWDTIYEPIHSRVITPVSRDWNSGDRGGYVLFCWDTFFAGMLAAIDNRDLAYANVVEILREVTPDGFVPNGSQATGRKSFDRSQPPVGSLSILALYRQYGDKWLLEQTFEPLLKWNRWWFENRVYDGYLCWGSNPFEPVVGDALEYKQQNTRFGAALESGLDNSPMYDDMPFDKDAHLMLLADVGLMSLMDADCRALAEIARALGREREAKELDAHAGQVRAKLQTLWSEEDGAFLNKRLDTGAFERRLSPTHFYPLISGAATEEQAQRLIDEHFFNPDEFWGDWILPAIARNDPAYADQRYWRGRIWAPMNWLVYLGLRNYPRLEKARKALVAKSTDLLLKEWREKRHIHENYNGDTGEGCDVDSSDSFYHWGGLLGLIALWEAGGGGGENGV